MNDVTAITLAGGDVVLEQATVGAFKAGLRGHLLSPHDAGYDAARTVWNAMIDKRPAPIVRCAGVADVIHALNLLNSLSADEGDETIKAAFGTNYDQLMAVKRKYDPANFFHLNLNIKPPRPSPGL